MTDNHNFQTSYLEGVNKFQGLRSKAFWQEMISLLTGQSSELLCFEEVRARLRLRAESYKGLQDIPLEQIVGSVGRHKEFTRTFLPRTDETRERWGRVYAKMNSMEGVPAIEVYQVGDVYFVRDGNHRVSVARELKAKTIQAHVTELPADIHLEPGMTLDDLDEAAVYVNFLEESQLKFTRPNHRMIKLSNPSAYIELLGHIYLHGQVLEQISGEPVAVAEAAADWYDKIYEPAIELIEKHQVLLLSGDEKKGCTPADLYIWMVNHLRDIRQRYGAEASARKFSHALVDYLAEKKIPIPRELLDEADSTVILSRTQVIKQVEEEEHRKTEQ